MPIWKVSLTDGIYQVADADGALYPITMGDSPLTRFNEGWSPRGLQTGIPPFHVLELEHVSGGSTLWLLDETLTFRANTVIGLSPEDRQRLADEIDPLVRTVYAECVLAPHASIPAAAHRFDGMLPQTVWLLTADAVSRIVPRPDQVALAPLGELGAGYGNGAATLSWDWIARALDAPAAAAQQSFALPGRTCRRHLDGNGTVFYRIEGDDPAAFSLYVPSANVVFHRGALDHTPIELLFTYYATTTDRVVSLPEALDLGGETAPPPPQYPSDAPPAEPEPEIDAAEPGGHDNAGDGARTVFEAPLSETAAPHAAEAGFGAPGEIPDAAAPSSPVPHPFAGDLAPEEDAPIAPAPVVLAPISRAPDREPLPAPKQNWWQRLLGLGNP